MRLMYTNKLDPFYKSYGVENSPRVIWGYRAQKAIFTKKCYYFSYILWFLYLFWDQRSSWDHFESEGQKVIFVETALTRPCPRWPLHPTYGLGGQRSNYKQLHMTTVTVSTCWPWSNTRKCPFYIKCMQNITLGIYKYFCTAIFYVYLVIMLSFMTLCNLVLHKIWGIY